MDFDNIKTILREGRNYTTSLGIVKGHDIREFDKIKFLYIVPFGKQTIEETPVMVKTPSLVFFERYYSVTLYKQRNGRYIVKFKITEVTEA